MTDIVERLRREGVEFHEQLEAAADIERMRDEIERLRAVLQRRGDALLSIAIGGNGEHNWTLDEVRAVARDAVEFLPPD